MSSSDERARKFHVLKEAIEGMADVEAGRVVLGIWKISLSRPMGEEITRLK